MIRTNAKWRKRLEDYNNKNTAKFALSWEATMGPLRYLSRP